MPRGMVRAAGLQRWRRFLVAVTRALLTSVILLLGAASTALALDIEFSGRAMKRDILAIYDSRHEKLPVETRIHRFAEMPLNHLGYRVSYLDVNGELPLPAELARYRGILTWFIEPMAAPGRYIEWLDAVTARGLRLAFFSELAPHGPRSHEIVAKRILARLGLEPTGHFVAVSNAASVVEENAAMVGFEKPVGKLLPDFRVYLAIPGRARIHFSVKTPTRIGERTAVLVSTGPGGGYVCDELSTYFEPNTDKVRWIVNPFLFFREAFGEDRFPIPDVTTLSGRRIYFSHIDGDGWNNLTEVEQFRAARLTAGEVIAREAIEAFPDLPVSVGLIAGDVDGELGGVPEGAALARRLYALPQVEVASHTYTHPFDWGYFENYSRSDEQRKIDAASRPALPVVERMKKALIALAGRSVRSDPSNPYIAGSSDLPRTYLRIPFDLDKEVAGALKVSQRLAPPGKKAKLYLWSGDTTPFEAAVAATRKAGVRNMNGGDSRLDKDFPSVFYVPPISRPVGKERQIYAVNSNENTYTNDWTGPYFGFFMLQHTLDNTETPRRLKPFNLYYHMYSGEKPAALASIKQFLALARKSEVIPIEASDYAAIADDYFAAEIRQVDLFAWSITARGALQTVRFDDADEVEIDIAKSRGVLGSNRKGDTLYVTLDQAVERVVVALRTRDLVAIDERATQPTSLVHARWRVYDRIEEGCGFRVTTRGFGPGDMVWRTAPRRAYRIQAEAAGRIISDEVRTAGVDGLIALRLNAVVNEAVSLRFRCHD